MRASLRLVRRRRRSDKITAPAMATASGAMAMLITLSQILEPR